MSYKVGDVEVFYAGAKDSPPQLQSSNGKPVCYEDIKKHHNVKNLFEDPDFPADPKSIGIIGGDQKAGGSKSMPTKWARPYEICKVMNKNPPKFAIKPDNLTAACSEHDIAQGGLGDCWYLAAVGALCKRGEKLSFVIPQDNFDGFDDGKYCGAFHFRFYILEEGKWFDIVIDDRIPCMEVNTKSSSYFYPAFTQVFSSDPKNRVTEFWPALIEKAYAKFIGSYEKIEGGYSSQALENFTGGFAEVINLQDIDISGYTERSVAPTAAETVVVKLKGYLASDNDCFVGVDTFSADGAVKAKCLEGYSKYQRTSAGEQKIGYKVSATSKRAELDNKATGLGLCAGHAYTILAGKEVKTKSGEIVYMVQLKNPHRTHEWIGKYSDKDNISWSNLEEDLRTSKDNSKDIDEGIFWMEINDVMKYFSTLESCMFNMEETCTSTIKGEWAPELQEMNLQPVASNFKLFPAYKFNAKQVTSEKYGVPKGSSVMIYQVIFRGYHCALNPKPFFYAYLYKVTEDDLKKPLDKLFRTQKAVDKSQQSYGREVCKVKVTEDGTYIIVPVLYTGPIHLHDGTTGPPIPKEFRGKPMPFTIRVITENEAKLELVEEP